MSWGRRLGSLLVAVSVGVALAACGSTGIADVARLAEDSVGSWELQSAEFDEGRLSPEALEEMGSRGLRVTLDMNGDGDALIDAFGDQQTGTWKIKDAETLSLTIDGESVEALLADGRLTLSLGGETMVFAKASDEPVMDRDPSENAGDLADVDEVEMIEKDVEGDIGGVPDVSEFSDLFSDEMIVWQRVYSASVELDVPLSIAVADDDVARVEIIGIGTDAEGDTGYLVSVENRTDADFLLTNATTLLNGRDVWDYATICCVVAPGEQARGFLYFDHEVVSVTVDSTCDISFVAMGRDESVLALYDVTVPGGDAAPGVTRAIMGRGSSAPSCQPLEHGSSHEQSL